MPKSINVLLIDDEVLFVRNLIQVLKRRGMVVQGANSGAAAMELIAAAEPGSLDVVVLDMRMPGMDGLATLKAIREREPSIPVILLTGQSDLKQVSQALKEGINEILLKPCPVDTLVSTIENVHERRVLAGELADKT
ncbi:MAG: response regulator [Syntrophobacteraceae bacterium]